MAEIFTNKSKARKILEKYRSTQFFTLIQNMIMLLHESLVLMKKIEKYGLESNCFTPTILAKTIFLNTGKKRKKAMRSVLGKAVV
jgi:hypothetical protein